MKKKFPTPKLVPLDMSLSDESEHPQINSKDTFLCLIGGTYHTGRFSKQWYGWNFEGVYDAGLQFDAPVTNSSDWQQIWRIVAPKAGNVRHYMTCPKCKRNLRRLGTCNGDPEGFRHDYKCKNCNQVYGCSKSSLFPIAEQEE